MILYVIIDSIVVFRYGYFPFGAANLSVPKKTLKVCILQITYRNVVCGLVIEFSAA